MNSCAMVTPRLATEPGEQDRHAVTVQEAAPRSRYQHGRRGVDARLGGAAWQQHDMNSRWFGSEGVERASMLAAWQVPDRLALTVAAFGTLSVAVAVVVAVIRTDLYHEPPDADWSVLAFLGLGLLVGETSRRCWIRSGPNTYVTPVYLFAFALLLVGSPDRGGLGVDVRDGCPCARRACHPVCDAHSSVARSH